MILLFARDCVLRFSAVSHPHFIRLPGATCDCRAHEES